METIPLKLKERISRWRGRTTFSINEGAAVPPNPFFPIVLGGYVSYETDSEGIITSTDPVEITRTKGDSEPTGPYTPLYPYVSIGSIIESTNDTVKRNTIANSKNFPLVIIDTLDRSSEKVQDGMYKYDYRVFVCQNTATDMPGETHEEDVLQDILQPLSEMVEQQLDSLGLVQNSRVISRPRWGDNKKYGRDGKNVFNQPVDAMEMTGTITYNRISLCT